MTNPLLETSGLPQYSRICPEHIEPALDTVIEDNRAALQELLNSDPVAPHTALQHLEAMSDRLHRVWSPVSHLHMVANTEQLREAYNAALPRLSRYSTELSQNAELHRLYTSLSDKLPADADKAERFLVEHALRDFHLAGVDLPAADKSRFKAIMEQLSELQARFDQNVLDSMKSWTRHIVSAEETAGIPMAVLQVTEQAAKAKDLSGWLLSLDQPTYIGVMTYADNRELREAFYAAWSTRASANGPGGEEFDNTPVIEELLKLRHEAANLVGFESYAAYALASRMAGSVGEVTAFLDNLAELSYPVAKDELAELEAWAGQPLQPWDVGYYSEKLRLERFSVSDEELRPYFPLSRVMQGLFGVLHNLYRVSATEKSAEVDRWQPEVRYYQLKDASGQVIGSFYMDLFARPDKRSGAWMDECLIRNKLGGQLQTPVAHLVCNYTAPSDGKEALLSHDEIVTLFHEFGHTLHHLLTRIDYPSVSGINGVPWDAVELPSQFMENYAWDPSVIRSMSQNVDTGEPLPEELLDKLEASRVFQAGMQMVRQLEFALFDWRLHSEYSPQLGSRKEDILAEVRAKLAVITAPDYNRFPNSFSHIFAGGYAAGYYSYKWAEVLAADSFAAFREAGLFDQETAQRFRQQILEVGGAAEISDAFIAFRGRQPKIEPLLEQCGMLAPEPTPQAAT